MQQPTPMDDAPARAGSEPAVRLAPGLDVAAVARVYRAAGRVHVPAILEREAAARVHRCLVEEVPWQLHFNDGERTVDLPGEQVEQLPEATRSALFGAIHSSPASRFQFLFDNFSLWDAQRAGTHGALYAMRVLEFLNGAPFLDFVRQVTGNASITFADAQATRYRSGHFLTCHDDVAEGKGRIAAYVLNFTPQWRADWGGILQFVAADGHLSEGYTPAFNALNLFRVPQPHAVSYVTPFARGARYSISGWLRAGEPR